MSAATLVYVGLGMTGYIVFWHGVLMLAVLLAYIGFTVWHDNNSNDAAAETHREEAKEMGIIHLRTVSICGIIVTGLFAIVVGAEWLVYGATNLAIAFGVPEEVIGLTIVAIGTSLPELATSIVAAYRGHSDVCVGNVLGSNVFNLFGITRDSYSFRCSSDKIANTDLWILLAATAIILPFLLSGRTLTRIVGLVFVGGYVVSGAQPPNRGHHAVTHDDLNQQTASSIFRMMTESKGNILITGAAQRIGRAIAIALAADGWTVGIHYFQSPDGAEALCEELNTSGANAYTAGADLSDETAIGKLMDRAAAYAPVTCLVNNASVFERDELDTVTQDSWDIHMAVNLWQRCDCRRPLLPPCPVEFPAIS